MKEKILTADQGAGPGCDGSLALKVNGKMVHSSASTMEDLIEELGQGNKRIVVELNGSIVAREAWRDTALSSEAEIELVQFVGGG
ncbi:sulfur carrier protein ThiS [Paenibacillus sp. J5C_2022]|nr:sulfur carrier protein ThiS [Paenibacillus sp. J5C2022]MCU6710414.1 sulfur carrier protein ThiS [Paenibacillus sp. J5C2022]